MTGGYAIGLMTGTSGDGIDAALVAMREKQDGDPFPAIRLVHSVFVPFTAGQRENIFSLFSPDAGVLAMARMHVQFGYWLTQACQQLLEEAHITPEAVEVIGAHGQTIAHYPPNPLSSSPGVSLQIGDPAVLAAKTGIDVVSQFRSMDIAHGGQGAPLVPYFDFVALRSPDEDRIILNLGGVANITFLPRQATLEDVVGFDTGPGNMVLDTLTHLVTQGAYDFDESGDFAGRGRSRDDLVHKWLQHPYFLRTPPKSTGREEFGIDYCQRLYAEMTAMRLSPQDMLRTATRFVAQSIAQGIAEVSAGPYALIATGGGTHNKTLMQELAGGLNMVRPWESTDHYGIPNDMKEAMAFAYLAWQFVQGRPTNLPRVTGAAQPVLQGMWTPAPNRPRRHGLVHSKTNGNEEKRTTRIFKEGDCHGQV